MPKADDYICPKCTYNHKLRERMRSHFYDRKTPCANKTGIELNEEIKAFVLIHHNYVPPKEKTINMVNVIASMDLNEKLQHLLEYQGKKQIGFENYLEQKMEHRSNRLENDDAWGGYFLDQDGLFKIINEITKIDETCIEKFNIYFDKTINRVNIYQDNKWESFLEEIGVKELISLLKSYFLNVYELYLIRNLHIDKPKVTNRYKLKESLEYYYKFLAIFGLPPHISEFNDKDILGHRLLENTEHYLAETYTSLYNKQKEALKISETKQVRKRVINIGKENTTYNESVVKKSLLDIVKKDETFKKQILESTNINV